MYEECWDKSDVLTNLAPSCNEVSVSRSGISHNLTTCWCSGSRGCGWSTAGSTPAAPPPASPTPSWCTSSQVSRDTREGAIDILCNFVDTRPGEFLYRYQECLDIASKSNNLMDHFLYFLHFDPVLLNFLSSFIYIS